MPVKIVFEVKNYKRYLKESFVLSYHP